MSKKLYYKTLHAVEQATRVLDRLGEGVEKRRISKTAAEFLENVTLGAVLKFDESYSASKAYAEGYRQGESKGYDKGFNEGYDKGLNDPYSDPMDEDDDDDEGEYAGLDDEEDDPHTVTIDTVPASATAPQPRRPTTLKEFLDRVIEATRQQSPS